MACGTLKGSGRCSSLTDFLVSVAPPHQPQAVVVSQFSNIDTLDLRSSQGRSSESETSNCPDVPASKDIKVCKVPVRVVCSKEELP